MGIVTDYLHSVIEKQINEHQMVVWYDPEPQYSEVAAALSIPDTTIVRYTDSFFALRYEIDGLLDAPQKPRLLIYIPLDPAQTYNALAEVEVSAVTMKPGQQPRDLNTRLSVIARNALKPILGEDGVTTIEKQIEAGKLTLADLDTLAEKGQGISTGTITLIFGMSNPEAVALAFLSSQSKDAEIASRGALPELGLLLNTEFEIEPPDEDETVSMYRERAARHLLVTDFISALGEIPPKLAGVPMASKSTTGESCSSLAQTWRLRLDLQDSYAEAAQKVDKNLDVAHLNLSAERLRNTETFLSVDRALQRHAVSRLLTEPDQPTAQLIDQRQKAFWSEYIPEVVRAEWSLIQASSTVLLESSRIEDELKSAPKDIRGLFRAYTEGEQPWCLLDTAYRHMESRYHAFNFGAEHIDLEKLIHAARARYMEIGSALAEKFLRQYEKAKFKIIGIPRQVETFDQQVKPRLSDGKTAYVWVDALRYEMARELADTLRGEFDIEIGAAVGTTPTVTEVGMAALLPGAQELMVAKAQNGKLIPQLGDVALKGRKERIKLIEATAGVKVYTTKPDELLPTPKTKVKEGMGAAQMILVTSQEIDELCEGDNIHLARQTMDSLLHDLGRVFRILSVAGVKSIIVVADHGYLFGDELGEEMKIDAPGGITQDLGRRSWVGNGGAENSAFMRAKLSDFGLSGDLEFATPWNFAGFKAPSGARAYFHGGLSPQELVIPILILKPTHQELTVAAALNWIMTPSKPKISNRLFSVRIEGTATQLFDWAAPKVRIEVRSNGEVISIPANATYGLEEATGNVQLERDSETGHSIVPNTITVRIVKDTVPKQVSVHLIDVASGKELVDTVRMETSIAI